MRLLRPNLWSGNMDLSIIAANSQIFEINFKEIYFGMVIGLLSSN